MVAGSFERKLGEGGEFAGHAEVGDEVGAVRGDFDFEHGVDFEVAVYGGADWGVGGEDHEAIGIVAEADFAAGAHHALTEAAAQGAFFDFKAAGEDGSGEGDGDFVARLEVFCAADDLAGGAGAIVDLTKAEAVGVRVGDKGEHFTDDQKIGADAALGDAFDFDAGKGEEVGELGGGVGGEV